MFKSSNITWNFSMVSPELPRPRVSLEPLTSLMLLTFSPPCAMMSCSLPSGPSPFRQYGA
jgi:hypothetical protein